MFICLFIIIKIFKVKSISQLEGVQFVDVLHRIWDKITFQLPHRIVF